MSRSCHSAMFSKRGVRVAAQQARQADDLLGADRIALVRHRRRALLSLAERLLDLADFGLLQPAHFERELLQRGAGDRDRREQLGVTIALNHLRGDRRRLETEAPADVLFDRRRQVPERPHGSRQLADADHRARAADPVDVAADLGIPQRQLEPEGHRLRVHAMGAPDHRRAAVLERALADRLRQAVEIRQQHVARFAHLQRLGGVDDVRRGETEVQPARRRPHLLRDRGGEGDHVVLGDLLDFLDARDVEGAALADVAGGVGRYDAERRHGVGGGGFHEQPGLVAALVAPDPPHVRMGVARNHLIEID